MEQKTHQLWEQYHNGEISIPDKRLADSWARCSRKHVDPKLTQLHCCIHDELCQRKRQISGFFFLASSILKYIVKKFSNPSVGIAVFDGDGFLMKLYGPAQFLSWANEHGFQPGTCWGEDFIGTNAVSLGLQEGLAAITTKGADHYCKLLTDSFISFATCNSNDFMAMSGRLGQGNFFAVSNRCYGIAILGPESEAETGYSLVVDSLSTALSISIRNIQLCYDMMNTNYSGLCLVALVKGQFIIKFPNASLCDILDIGQQDLSNIPLEKVVDPLPKNAAFWDLIKQNHCVNNYKIPLSIRGVVDDYCVTTSSFNSQMFEAFGVFLAITSNNSEMRLINTKVGHYAKCTFFDIIGESSEMLRAIRLSAAAAQNDSNILILGESGVGKDLFAQAIHNSSSRRDKPFVSLNCAAIPRDLVASELFGYEQGAFTGARRTGNIGKFELANGGTLFLDEIGDMPLDLQALLLRVIEQKQFMRLGSNKIIHANVKIIAATNVDLAQRIRQKAFREDLYYRLKGIQIVIPPLRERANDVELLTQYFIQRISSRLNRGEVSISDEAVAYLRNYSWPGNVRELQNLLETLITFSYDNVISLHQIQDFLVYDNARGFDSRLQPISESTEPPLQPEEDASAVRYRFSSDFFISEEMVVQALEKTRYNKVKAAATLGISRSTLYKLLAKYGIE